MKGKRQEKILDIIKEKIILTQEDLQNALISYGYNVTQSTVSRDIKELKLIKDHDSEGNYRYISVARSDASIHPEAHYRDMIANSVRYVSSAMNDVVIKCYNGTASSACVAIDAIFSNRMLGSIAGDDTILIITGNSEDATVLANNIKKLM